MTRPPSPLPELAPVQIVPPPPIPELLHCPPHLTRRYGGALHAEPELAHPCGTVAERGVTHSPASHTWNYATSRPMRQPRPNCPSCLEAERRHSEACAAVREGRGR